MKLISYTFEAFEYQGKLNELKDNLIEAINRDHNLKLNPGEYMVVIRTQGCLGRFFDKLFGTLPDTQSHIVLMRCRPENSG